ncbi:MAG: D-alanyl-D-alanine carboxypeptidase [Francisella sp.]|jgi:D-alanyl-D-alanine carboxypeptidase
MVKRPIFKEALKSELMLVGKDFFKRDVYLEKNTHNAWLELQKKAHTDNVKLDIVSGFRSYAYQQSIIDRKLTNGLSLEQISKVNALVGESEHHTGCAIDFTTDDEVEVLTEDFEKTRAFKWLQNNAKNFGFKMSFPRDNKYGFIYEPWHWCYKDEDR